MDLTGRRFLVTGAGTGIGRSVATRLAELGADVALHFSHSSAGAESALIDILGMGRNGVALQADLGDANAARALPHRAADALGGLDGLVNNAGITMNRALMNTTVEQFDTLFNVNVRGMFFCTQGAVEIMQESGFGTVVNLSSVHAFGGLVEHSVYAATKAAILGFTRTTSIELIQKGIRMNCIASGWVLVENQRKALGSDFDDRDAGLGLPVGFIGTGDDMGNLVAFLSVDLSRYIVGQTIVCDGGQTTLLPATGNFREPTEVQFGQDYVPGL